MRKIVALILLALMVATGFGCVAVSEWLTPTPVDKAAIKYAVKAGVADANSYRGYANLEKARRLGAEVKAAYEVNKLALDQLAERNELDYGILTEVVTRNRKIGERREAALFDETGLLPIIAGAAGMGGLGGLLGLMRKRPGDITPVEFEQATAQAGINLKDRDRQMLEIVGGVSEFMRQYDKKSEPGIALRTALRTKTNTDTKQVVAALRVV